MNIYEHIVKQGQIFVKFFLKFISSQQTRVLLLLIILDSERIGILQ